MANYSNLKAAIAAAIKTNGNQEITGQVLQDVLTSMVSVIGANYTFAGVATPSTNPGTPDQNVFYLASKGGTYTNFSGIEVKDGFTLLVWNGTWTSLTLFTFNEISNYLSADIPIDLTKLNTFQGWVSATGDCLMQGGSAHYVVPLDNILNVTIIANTEENSYFTFATEVQPNGQYTRLSSVGRFSVNANESGKFLVPYGANYLIVGVKSLTSSPVYTPSAVLLSHSISEVVEILLKQQMTSINFFAKRYIDYDSDNGIVKIPSWGTFIFNNEEFVFGYSDTADYTIENVTNTILGTTSAYLVYDTTVKRSQTLTINPFSVVKFADIQEKHAVVAAIRLVHSSAPEIYPQMVATSPWSINGAPYGLKELKYNYLAPVLFFRKDAFIEYDSVNHTVSIGNWGVVYKNNGIYVFSSNTKYVLSNITNTALGTTTAFLVFDTSLGSTQFNQQSFNVINPNNIEEKHALIAIIRLVSSSDSTVYPQITTLAPWSINGMPYGFSVLKEDDGLVLPLTPAAINSQGANKGITLNVMSYNVANYNDDTATFLPNDKVIEYRRMLNEIVPDLVGTQEDREDIDGNGQKNAAQYLYNPVYPYLYIGGTQYPAVRSKYPAAGSGCLKYSNMDRYLEYTTYNVGGKILLFISTHAVYNYNGHTTDADAIAARFTQYNETIQWAEGLITLVDKTTSNPVSCPEHDYVIICGDMNTATDTDKENLLSVLYTYNYTCANGGKLGWIKTAPRYSGTMLSIDNIICSENVVIESVKSYYELYDKLYSDHVPLLAKVTLLDT